MKKITILALLEEYAREKQFKGEYDDLRIKLLKKFLKTIEKDQIFSAKEFIHFCHKRKADIAKLFHPKVASNNSASSNLFAKIIKFQPLSQTNVESNQGTLSKLPREIIFTEIIPYLDDISAAKLASTSSFFRHGLSERMAEDYFLKKIIAAGFEKESVLQASIKNYKKFYYTFLRLPNHIKVNKALCRRLNDTILYWLNVDKPKTQFCNIKADQKLSKLLLGFDDLNSLHYAMITGPLSKVKDELISRGMSYRDIFDFNYLKIAAYTGNYKLLRNLIGPKTILPMNAITNNVITLFEYAILSGNMPTIKFVYDVFATRKYPHLQEQRNLLLYAIESGNCEVVKYVEEKFSETIDHKNSTLILQLHGLQGSYFDHAVNTGNLELVNYVVSLYKKIGVNLSDLIASSKINLLNLAAERGNPELMRYLYEAGAPLKTNQTGITILHGAIMSANVTAMQYAVTLLQANNISLEAADPEAKDYLQFAVSSKIPEAIIFLRQLPLNPHASTKKHPESAYEMALRMEFGQYNYPESIRNAMTQPLSVLDARRISFI